MKQAQYLIQEQKLLKELREKKGITSWKKIANIINGVCKDFTKTGKQYRDRYVNYIRFNEDCPKIIDWTQQDEINFFRNYFKYGAKWVQISMKMQGRSENNLKNKFYGIIRKVSRRIQKFQKSLKPKPKKFLTQRHIIKGLDECRRITEYKSKNELTLEGFPETGIDLQQKLIRIFLTMTQQTSDSEIYQLICLLKKLNISSLQNLEEQIPMTVSLQSQVDIEQMEQKTEAKNTSYELHQFHSQKTLSEISEAESGQNDKQDSRWEIIQDFLKNPIKNHESQDLMEELCSILKCNYTPDNFALFQ